MASIENDRKRSKKSKKAKDEAALSEEATASAQLKALVEAAQVEWQIAGDQGIEFTEGTTDAEPIEIEASEDIEAEEDNQLESSNEAVEFIEADQAVSIIESLLFSSEKPVSLGTFKQIFKGTNIKSKDITRAI